MVAIVSVGMKPLETWDPVFIGPLEGKDPNSFPTYTRLSLPLSVILIGLQLVRNIKQKRGMDSSDHVTVTDEFVR